jgi:3-dehydroquinate synthetase
MMAAAAIGEVYGVTPPDVRPTIEAALKAQKLPTAFPPEVNFDNVLPLMARDKKAEGGKAKFVLAESAGRVGVYSDVEEAAIREGIQRVVPS